ncbi:pantothenate kinase [Musa troglodytarum]|uniref:Pantothenate kinase n=1 Tax=Musa troglodytarum TaxID=320322 RepID=A0A9E7GJ73_9LILI|nr:pantothenate kinase [Musa troglodytarum]
MGVVLEAVGIRQAVGKGRLMASELNNSNPDHDYSKEKLKHSSKEEMVSTTTNSMHRSSSRPQLDVSRAAIQGDSEDTNPTILLPNQSDDISHLALDIGGSLIKLVYFSRHEEQSPDDKRKRSMNKRFGLSNGNRRSYPILGGRLHFVKFETGKLNECLDFISSKQLHRGGIDSPSWRSGTQMDDNIVIKATGGGAYKFADVLKERLGVSLDKEDEMSCLVAGANFLLKAIRHEAFTHMDGQKEFVQIDHNDMFPYLLVNVGSGVSIIKVDGDGKYQRVSGTNVGGGTYWGLGRLLTKCMNFDELLELSQQGDNSNVDMLVGDIYGGLDYSKIGLSASTIASSFGKTISETKELSDYRPEDISLSLLRMISYNIGQISWLEKFVQKGTEITAPVPMAPPGTTGMGGFERPSSRGNTLRSDASAALNIGVLHLVPTLEEFPLLADPKMYEPNTTDLLDHGELEYWFTVLSEHLPDLVDKAVASEGGTDDAKRRGDAFAHAFSAHLARLMEEPAAYGKLGLAKLLELREECLREFQFMDAYITIKQRENEASLAVLPDLLIELDSMNEEDRLLALIEGVLAANIFDWGSRACVDLYHKGTIIEIYRMSRKKMQRPWRVDDFDMFKERMLGSGDKKSQPYKRALFFVDNSGADVVLGMLPLARELLRRGTEVVLVANSLPALNDVTVLELPEIVAEAAKHCDIIRKAAEAGGLLMDAMVSIQEDGLKNHSTSVSLMVSENGSGGPCIDLRQVSSELAAVAKDADLIILEGMGRAIHTNLNAHFKCDALKLAMVKNQRLAEKLFNGNIYDCICRFEPGKEQL